jgi:RNA polymerase sigma factor (sigma-70 family)
LTKPDATAPTGGPQHAAHPPMGVPPRASHAADPHARGPLHSHAASEPPFGRPPLGRPLPDGAPLGASPLDVSDASDALLLAAVRTGTVDAYGELYARHVVAARRLAAALARDPADAEDLVAEAFAKILATLRLGRGPDLAFRPYLLTTLRHVSYDRARRDKRVELTDDITRYETGAPFLDTTVADLERSYAARAFAKMPERWRMVLWHTEVEGETPAEIAPLLGLTPNGVAALAYRARERLRQMYLQEHVAVTADPTCHDTAERLGGYVRGSLAGREKSKVDAHLSDCATCRLLHVELAEVNSSLRTVLAPLLLSGSAAAYLAATGAKGSAAAGLVTGGGAATGLGAVWSTLVDWLHTRWAAGVGWAQMAWVALLGWAQGAWAAVAGWVHTAWTWPVRLVRRLVQRHGPGNVAAGGVVVAAIVIGIALFIFTLVAHPVKDHSPPSLALPPGPGAVNPPPGPALPQPAGSPGRSAATPQTARPAPAAVSSPTPAAPAGPFEITPDLMGGQLVAASAGILPVTLRAPRPGGRGAATGTPTGGTASRSPTRAATRSFTRTESSPAAARPPGAARQVQLAITLPPGVRLAGTDAANGWRCTATPDGGTCRHARLAAGASSTARVPVTVTAGVTGFQPVAVAITMGTKQTRASFRVPIAPAGMTVGYAKTGRVRLAMAGNTLLSCPTRPACLSGRDNQQLPMAPYVPGPGDPVPPAGLLPGGPSGPGGPIRKLAGTKAASGARLVLPAGARVAWAGLYWAASGSGAPGLVTLHGPGGAWNPVSPLTMTGGGSYSRPLTQAYADVTPLLRSGGAGAWWLAARAAALPAATGAYAGWSLLVAYEDATASTTDLAVYAGPLPLHGDATLTVRAGQPHSRAQVGLVAWDGDRNLTGDELRLGGTALGPPDNVASSTTQTAVECARAPVGCRWNTLGVDVATYGGTVDPSGNATLRAGDDPFDVGVLAIAATQRS